MKIRLLIPLVCAALMASCEAKEEAIIPAVPIRFAVTDIEGLEQLQLDFGPFKEALEKSTGMPVEFFPVSSRTAAAEALKAGKIDVVMAGPAEYIVIAKRTGATPLVGFARNGYTSAIITTKEKNIRTLQDLKGKTVAFEDVGSTARHLMPMQMIADAGIDPLKDITAMHTSKTIMHEALKKGDIDAMAQSYENWQATALAHEPQDVQNEFIVVAQSEPLPNDVLMVGTHVSDAITAKLREAFASHSGELISALTASEDNAKYLGMKFVLDISDSDYDAVRKMFATVGYPEYSEFLE